MASSTSRVRKADAESIVTEAPPRKVLRLRTSVDESCDWSSIDVSDVSSVRLLSRLERRLHTVTDMNELVETIVDKLRHSQIMMMRCKLLQLLRKIVAKHQVDHSFIAEEIFKQINDCDSHDYKSELLSLCSALTPHISSNNNHLNTIISISKKCLSDRSSTLRAMSLLTMSDVIKHGCSGLLFEDSLGMQLLIIDFIRDPEPRVRSVALEALSSLHEGRYSLEPQVYDQATHALTDDYERVRTAALRLTTSLALTTPDRIVKSGSNQSLSALDDGFAKVCDAINDGSFIVRTQAAKLLAEFTGVSQDFLEQTLDKKLMSNMRRKQSAHERQKQFYQSGEWSSGKRFADDAPKESIAEESVSLISMGACGAFVHALEDEFMEVREAAIQSMCTLAQSNPLFARHTQDFLVDMFNDEIEEVRLQAIHALCKIAQHLSLRDDQVDIITGTLKDFGGDIRTGLHRLIQGCRISTQSGIRYMILALLDNIRKYPQDRKSIWRAMEQLGRKHPGLISPLLPELLSLDPHFEMPEPNMADDCYVAVMIAVYNAASEESHLISLFPSHAERHYRFHRRRFTEFIPPVPLLEQGELISNLAIRDSSLKAGEDNHLSDIQEQITRANKCNNISARSQLLTLCLRDLKHSSSIGGDVKQSSVSSYLCDYIQCLIVFHKIEKHRAGGEDKLVLSLSSQVIVLCERLINLYREVPTGTSDVVRQFQLISLTLSLICKMETNSALPEEFKLYLKQLTQIKGQLNTGYTQLPGISRILDVQETLEAGNWSILQNAVNDLNLTSLPLPDNINSLNITKIQCELEEPKTRSDNPRRFTAGLAVCLNVRATMRSTKPAESCQLYIRVRLPDQSEVITPVKPSQISRSDADIPSSSGQSQTRNSEEQIIKTRVVFSHGHWSESSYVEVCVLMRTDSLGEMIEISEPNKVYITTKLEKKAHVGNIM